MQAHKSKKETERQHDAIYNKRNYDKEQHGLNRQHKQQ